jgi:mono/diheme cytochrome c family protein
MEMDMTRFAAFSARTRLVLSAGALAALAVPAALAMAQGAPAAAPAKEAPLTAAQTEKARGLFNDNSCGGCHTLADGNGSGSIGPSLDHNTHIDHALVVDRITNGSGAMPAFGGQIPDPDIQLLASYVIAAKK